jgi:ABC-type transporter Mla maintaining outer membrane lipid asymmetry ATPase subunit MlaF
MKKRVGMARALALDPDLLSFATSRPPGSTRS